MPSLGYKGIRFESPAGYLPFKPLPKDARTWDFAQWAWSMSVDYTKTRGSMNLEYFSFSHWDGGITVAVEQQVASLPSLKDRPEYEQHVRWLAQTLKFPAGKVVLRDARRVGRHYVACAAREFPEYDRCNVVYLLAVPPKGMLVVNAVTTIARRE
ncbi:MAG TPA: hypothetical protein VGD81_04250, partial [Opitutaceae bacterium]